jgi:polysaccharide pyruvyl transferase CsaB
MSARILIAGAPTGCWTNAGDEAVLAAMVRDLRAALPEVELAVVSSNPPGALRAHGVREIPYADIPLLVEEARASDLLVLGGGSVFFDYWGFEPATVLTRHHEGLAFYGGFALLARLAGVPLAIYAVGVGPLHTERARDFTRWVFEQAALTTVRDAGSWQALSELGVDVSRVHVTADPAFGLPPPEPGAGVDGVARSAGTPATAPRLGVALREWDAGGIAPERWERAVADALDAFGERHGGSVVFVPLHRTVDWPLTDDAGVAERVCSLMRPGAAEVLPADLPLEAKRAALQGCDLVLAMRLHAAVFAAAASVPVVGLAYDPKVAHLFDALDAGQWVMPLHQVDTLAPVLGRAFEQRRELGAQLGARGAALAGKARENAALVADFLATGEHELRGDPVVDAALLRMAARLYELEQPAAAPAPAPLAVAAGGSDQGNEAAASLRAELDRIHRSRGWALLERAWRLRRRVVPAGGRLERALGLGRGTPAAEPSMAAAPAPPPLAAALAAARGDARVELAPARPDRRPGARRVALLTNRLLDWTTREPRHGGAERYAVWLGRLLRTLGFEVAFYQSAGTGAAFEGDYYGFPVTALARGGFVAEFEHGVGDAFHEASRGHDHVLYNMPNYGSGRMREDAVLVCHGIWFDHDLLPPPYTFRTPEWFEHLYRVFSRPRQVVSVDTNTLNVLRAWWPELGPRMTCIPNGVDTRLFKPPAARPAGLPTVLFPRRSDVIRGSRILGEILGGIPHRARMRWVGDGDGQEPDVIRDVARRDPRLEFFAASFDQMPALYQEAEVCVIPTVASEGTSLACLEGLASGCAVVATNVGGLTDLVQPGVNGLLVDPRPDAIAAAVNFLLEHPEERYRLQRAGRETALAFRLEVWEQRWTALLERLGWLGAAQPLRRAEGL